MMTHSIAHIIEIIFNFIVSCAIIASIRRNHTSSLHNSRMHITNELHAPIKAEHEMLLNANFSENVVIQPL